METWIIALIALLCLGLWVSQAALLKRQEQSEKAIKHIISCNTILARRMKELDGIEMKEVQHPGSTQNITILLDPKASKSEIVIDEEE